jgi:hypothetical protein
MPRNAVRAVASSQPIRADDLLAAVGALERSLGAVSFYFQRDHLRASLYRDAQALKPLLKQALGLGLGQHQRVIIRARHRIHFDVADHVATGRNDVDASDLEPGLNEGRGP